MLTSPRAMVSTCSASHSVPRSAERAPQVMSSAAYHLYLFTESACGHAPAEEEEERGPKITCTFVAPWTGCLLACRWARHGTTNIGCIASPLHPFDETRTLNQTTKLCD